MQSLSRALTVLAELNREDRAYGVTELAVTVGLHKSTVHRILATFCEHGLADRVGDHRYTALDGLAALRRTAQRRAGPEQSLTDLGDRLGRLVVLAKPLPKTAGTVLQVAAVAGAGCRPLPVRGAGRQLRRPAGACGLAPAQRARAGVSVRPPHRRGDRYAGSARRVATRPGFGFAHNAKPVASLPRMVAVPVRDNAGRCAGALGAELIQAGSIEEVRRVVSVLRSGV